MLGLLFLGVEHQKRPKEQAEGGNAGYVQGNQDAGDGGTDVGTEDDTGGLGQIHDPGVDKAHDHDGGGRGRLNDHGDQNAQQEPQEPIPGQLLQQVLHFGSGSHLQTVTHVLHSEQEGTQTTQQGNDVGYTHAYSSL